MKQLSMESLSAECVGAFPTTERENDELILEVMNFNASYEKRLKVLVFKARLQGMKDGIKYVQGKVNQLGKE